MPFSPHDAYEWLLVPGSSLYGSHPPPFEGHLAPKMPGKPISQRSHARRSGMSSSHYQLAKTHTSSQPSPLPFIPIQKKITLHTKLEKGPMVLQKDSLLQFCILFPDCMSTRACTVPRMIMFCKCFICILPLKAPQESKM